jgi:regulator of replication initiation timing
LGERKTDQGKNELSDMENRREKPMEENPPLTLGNLTYRTRLKLERTSAHAPVRSQR